MSEYTMCLRVNQSHSRETVPKMITFGFTDPGIVSVIFLQIKLNKWFSDGKAVDGKNIDVEVRTVVE